MAPSKRTGVLAIIAALAIVSGVLVGVSVNSPGSLFNLAGGAQCEPEEQAPPAEEQPEEQAPPAEEQPEEQAPPAEEQPEEQAPPAEEQPEEQAPPAEGGEEQQGGWGDQQGGQDQGDQQGGQEEPSWDQQSTVTRHLPSDPEPEPRQPARQQQGSSQQQGGQQQGDQDQGGQQQGGQDQGDQQQGGQDQGDQQQGGQDQGDQQQGGSWRDQNQGQDQGDQGQDQGGNEQQPPAEEQPEEEQPPAEECEQQEEEEQGEEEEEAVEPRNAEAGDYIDINDVEPNVVEPEAQEGASTGTFVSECGNGAFFNNDNFIVSPGVDNGAEHFHRAVGNESNDENASNDTLAAGETSCENPEDQSTYFWPVLRNPNGDTDPEIDGAAEGNTGSLIEADSVRIEFRGNPTSEVVPMPRFIRVIQGFAKAISDPEGAAANARPQFSCEGAEDRLTDKYPLCGEGNSLLRVHDFPSCWDGQNTDSENHRDHIVFPDEESGACPEGTVAVPQLRITASYTVGGPQTFELDTFPTEFAKPETDHDDFVNAMSDGLNAEVAECINSGQNCVNSADNAQNQTQRRSNNRTNRTKGSWRR